MPSLQTQRIVKIGDSLAFDLLVYSYFPDCLAAFSVVPFLQFP